LAAALAALIGLLLLGAAADDTPGPLSGVDPARLPALARESLPLIVDLTARHCPELPPLWVVAQVEAESGWDPTATTGGAAGLYQLDQRTWLAAGGAPWPSDPPAPGDEVLDVRAHLAVAIPWVCANLRAVGAHLAATGKPTPALDGMLVCHVAGCGRVTGSARGVPSAGEAGCGQRCAQLVQRYVEAVHGHLERYAAPAPAPEPDPQAAPAAWTGGATGCELADPTGDGCLTGATRHGLEAAAAAFGGWSGGPVIRSAGCWDPHRWNPRSDHPRGKACDLFPTAPGTFADGADLDAGWRLAEWFRTHAEPLRVKYLIWQGRYWDPGVADEGGWGRRYTGGGVYDVRDATGGHYDHIHVSFRE
ncbi:MAG TPA: hypothetical protein VD813_04470, partial [Pseudonocardia sp.]|nr:hypothetical protein [Pseudonocardia sp.]